jgi:hypothetical protein
VDFIGIVRRFAFGVFAGFVFVFCFGGLVAAGGQYESAGE